MKGLLLPDADGPIHYDWAGALLGLLVFETVMLAVNGILLAANFRVVP